MLQNGTINTSGAAYSFDLDTGAQLRKFVSSDTSFSADRQNFGNSVGIDGNTLFVGAVLPGNLYRFNLRTGVQEQILTGSANNIGYALSVDAGRVVSAASFDDAGSLAVFDSASGTLLSTLRPADASGTPYTFAIDPFSDGLGQFGGTNSVALSGSLALVGASGSTINAVDGGGAAFAFDISTGEQLDLLLPSEHDVGGRFGSAVALDGTTALVGADAGKGSVYVFDTTDFTQSTKLIASDGGSGDEFGFSVALDGQLAVIGARSDDSTGSAYVFNVETGEELAKLTYSDARQGGQFGTSVAIDGAKIVVGASGSGASFAEPGAAYAFDLTPRWQGVFGGDYDTAANWGVLNPGSAKWLDVEIAPDTTQIVTGPAGVSEVGTLIVGGGPGTVTLDLQQGGGIISKGLVRVDAGGVLTGDGGVIAPLILNAGTIDLQPGLGLNAQVINKGIVQGEGIIAGDFVNDEGAATVGRSGEQITFAGGVDNFGTIRGSNTTMRFENGIENRSGGRMQFSGGFTSLFGDMENGEFATILNSGNGTLTFYDSLFNAGEVRTSSGSSTVFFGSYTGPGSLTGGGDVFFEGNVATGASPALVDFTANVSLTNADTTEMELGGTLRGDEYDAWDVFGALTLGGTLNLVGIDGFFPNVGDSFTLFSASGGISGDFGQVNLAPLEGGRWSEVRTATSYGFEVSSVPLPAGAWLMLSGLGALALRRRVMRRAG